MQLQIHLVLYRATLPRFIPIGTLNNLTLISSTADLMLMSSTLLSIVKTVVTCISSHNLIMGIRSNGFMAFSADRLRHATAEIACPRWGI
ncbi:hypothetical protein C2S52_013879 [Perilla frutescens var. hirtella]|nr:hypothetical protein C2S52_013879 [Perilla frutescens var. hirtella]